MFSKSKGHKVDISESDIEIRMMEPEDENDLLDFFQAISDNFEKFKTFWHWRRENTTESGGENAAIAKKNGKVVGCVGIVTAAVTFNGSRLLACWQQDSLVSPAMRGKGLGKRLVNIASENMDIVMAKGTNRAMYGLRKSLGFLDVPNSNYLVRVCKPREDIKDLKQRIAEYFLCYWKGIVFSPRFDSSVEVKQSDRFDEAFDDLAEKLSTKNEARLYKGKDYLNWRYFGCPGKKYTVFKVNVENMCGAIVLNIVGENLDEGWIVDLICPAGKRNCGRRLISAAVRYFEERNVSRIWVFSTLPAKRRWFYRFGFLPTDRSPMFTYKVVGKSVSEEKIAKANWDFGHGDGDLELYG